MATDRRIIIEGDTIRYEEISSMQAPLASLAGFLTTRLPTTLPILPDNTVYVSIDPQSKKGVVVVGQKPRRHTLNIVGTPYRLQLPFQYFMFGFDLDVRVRGNTETLFNFVINQSHLYWRPTAYEREEDTFWQAQIPNVRSASICWGTTHAERSTFARNINDLVNNFNDTLFNADLGLPSPDYGHDYAAWQAASDDPLVYLRWPFWERERTNGHVFTMEQIWRRLHDDGSAPPSADLTDSFINTPTFPRNFTYARAREFLAELPAPQRRRIIAAATDLPTPRGRDIADPPDNPDPNNTLTEEAPA